MNFLKNIFKLKETETPDGMWLQGYKNSDWHTAFAFQNKNGQLFKTEVSFESCFRIQKGVFSILRMVDPYENNTCYMASLINDDVDEIHWLVNRIEDDSGECLRNDKWTKGVAFTESKTPGVKNGVLLIRNLCGLANFQSTPPYMLILTMNKEKWM
jgi:hypothetical protein